MLTWQIIGICSPCPLSGLATNSWPWQQWASSCRVGHFYEPKRAKTTGQYTIWKIQMKIPLELETAQSVRHLPCQWKDLIGIPSTHLIGEPGVPMWDPGSKKQGGQFLRNDTWGRPLHPHMYVHMYTCIMCVCMCMHTCMCAHTHSKGITLTIT